MSVATIQYFSPALNRHTSYDVILPRVGTGPYAVLMQLHGLTDDQHAWVYKSSLVEHVAGLPLLVVLPDGGTSGYLDLVDTEADADADHPLGRARYETAIVGDLMDHVGRVFNVRPGPWALGGLSMGGYGALRLGLKYPDRFASVWAHSSALRIGPMVGPRTADPADALVETHARRAAAAGTAPVLSFDCGTDDHLIDENHRFHDLLTDLGVAHTYADHPGGHTWDYWDRHVVTALAQHARVLGLETP